MSVISTDNFHCFLDLGCGMNGGARQQSLFVDMVGDRVRPEIKEPVLNGDFTP